MKLLDCIVNETRGMPASNQSLELETYRLRTKSGAADATTTATDAIPGTNVITVTDNRSDNESIMHIMRCSRWWKTNINIKGMTTMNHWIYILK